MKGSGEREKLAAGHPFGRQKQPQKSKYSKTIAFGGWWEGIGLGDGWL